VFRFGVADLQRHQSFRLQNLNRGSVRQGREAGAQFGNADTGFGARDRHFRMGGGMLDQRLGRRL
jgi:hypothetical protein